MPADFDNVSYDIDARDIEKLSIRLAPRYKRARAKAQAVMASMVITDSDPYVPFDTGMTAHSPMVASKLEDGIIIYDTPYARKIYYGDGIHFHPDIHPKASSRWFEHAKEENRAKWIRGAKREFARRFVG